MDTHTPTLPPMLTTPTSIQLRGSRTYTAYTMFNPETFSPESLVSPEILQAITKDVADTLSRDICTSRLLPLGQHLWAIAIWHPKAPRFIPTFENDAPSSTWIIPRGSILYFIDWTQGLILLSKGGNRVETSDLLQCFNPLFTATQRGRYCKPLNLHFAPALNLPYELRHPSGNRLLPWQELRLKEVLYLPPGEDIEYTRKTWEDDGFNTLTFQNELPISTVKEFTLLLSTPQAKRPLTLRVKNDDNAIKATLNASTLTTITRTLPILTG